MKRSTTLPLLLLIILALALSSTPYIAGLILNGKGKTFTGFTWNIDDACVYISWIRQVADGHLFFKNNYTNQAQHGLQFNFLFAVMGLAVRATRLSPTAIYHIFRLMLGAGLLLLAFNFARNFLPDEKKRLFFLALLAFSSGFGWILPENGHAGPIDTWQPEAVTFLSLYLNPLFLAGQILMLASLHYLLRARMANDVKSSIMAGLMIFLLANIHSYDVVIVGSVWIVYLAASCVLERKILWQPILSSALAAMISLPALGYQFYVYHAEEVFRLRANTPAPSPVIWSYFAGYGAIFISAIFGIPKAIGNRKRLLLVVWAVLGFMLPYLPFAQQRKFVMGLHIPLAILAVMALWPIAKKISWKHAKILAFAFIVFTAMGNLYFMRRDINWLCENQTATIYRPFLLNTEIKALEWLHAETKPDESVFAEPNAALFIPAVTGRSVYYGHWSETPGYPNKLRDWFVFVNPETSDDVRESILSDTNARYLMFGTDSDIDLSGKPYVKLLFQDGLTKIYRIESND